MNNILLYQQIARLLHGYTTTGKQEGASRFKDQLNWIAKNVLPSGSGIDNGTEIDLDKSHADKIVLTFGYHHMNDGGYYDGWTEHTAIIKPSLVFDIDITITGKNRNQIKEYLYDTYQYALTREFDPDLLKDI